MEPIGGLIGPSPLDATPKKKRKSIYIYTHIQLGPKKRNRIWPLCFQKLGPLHKIKIKTPPKQHHNLESTDAAPEVPHPRPTWRDAVACAADRVCVFFFFFLGFTPTRLDSRQRGSNHAELASIHIKPG